MNNMKKKSILVRRNGLLGLGNAGWEEFPSEKQLQIAISNVFNKYGHYSDKWAIIDDDYRDSDELKQSFPIDLGIIPLPYTLEKNVWDCIKSDLRKKAGFEMGNEIDSLLDGRLPPVLLYEDYGPIDGEKRIIMAHSLAIPVRTFILKRVR